MITKYDLIFHNDYEMHFYSIPTTHVCTIKYDKYEKVEIAVNEEWVHIVYSTDLMETGEEYEPIGETITPNKIKPETLEKIIRNGNIGYNKLNDKLRKIRKERKQKLKTLNPEQRYLNGEITFNTVWKTYQQYGDTKDKYNIHMQTEGIHLNKEKATKAEKNFCEKTIKERKKEKR